MSTARGLLALSPIAVFLLLYVVVSAMIGDFYKMPLSITFIVASVWALLLMPKMKIIDRIEIFSSGAANTNILYMIWIFILAGAFSALAKGVGAIDATVKLTLWALPPGYIVPGLFVVTCFISMSIGTSVGTIVALTPFAVQLAATTGGNVPYYTAVVLSGSFFGDNLSFISDTTIAATRSLKVKMSDKFKTNLLIALPAALVVLGVYVAMGIASPCHEAASTASGNWWLVLPYLVVIATAMCGVNVMIVLTLGIACCIAIATVVAQHAGLVDMCTMMGKGVQDMSDLIIVTLLAAGLLEVINYNGGIKYLIQLLTRHIGGSRAAQAVIALLVSLTNVCTANNTIAIITVGSISRHIATQFHVDPRKAASLLDTGSCIVQSLIPYGAQSLMAAGLAHVSPVAFLPYMYYSWGLAAMVALSIVFNFPQKGSC